MRDGREATTEEPRAVGRGAEGELLSQAATSTQKTSRGASWRSRARDVLVASASICVLAFLVLFAVAGPTADLDTSMGPVVPRPGPAAVVEGRVLGAAGDGLAGATVTARRVGGISRETRTSADGSFRVALRGGCARYVVSLEARADGETFTERATRHLCPGDSLPVDARVITTSHFLWVPGPR